MATAGTAIIEPRKVHRYRWWVHLVSPLCFVVIVLLQRHEPRELRAWYGILGLAIGLTILVTVLALWVWKDSYIIVNADGIEVSDEVQQWVVFPEDINLKKQFFGRMTLSWPGRSVILNNFQSPKQLWNEITSLKERFSESQAEACATTDH